MRINVKHLRMKEVISWRGIIVKRNSKQIVLSQWTLLPHSAGYVHHLNPYPQEGSDSFVTQHSENCDSHLCIVVCVVGLTMRF